MSRKKQLEQLAKELYALEKKYNVGFISSNGFKDILVIDHTTGNAFDYQWGKGKLGLSWESDYTDEELKEWKEPE